MKITTPVPTSFVFVFFLASCQPKPVETVETTPAASAPAAAPSPATAAAPAASAATAAEPAPPAAVAEPATPAPPPSPTTPAPAAATGAAAAAPVSCRPEQTEALPAAEGRARRCVIDVGSRNVKLLVVSAKEGEARSLTTERVCRSRMQLGEKVFDLKTQQRRPLPPADQEALARLITDYAGLCTRDGGEMTGAMATEWARRATNTDEARALIKAKSGVNIDVLSRETEGRYGHLAATRGAPGKMVLDFGSRSVQLSFWPRGAAAPDSASLPMGIDEAGDQYFGNPRYKDYGPARAAFAAAVKKGLAPALAKIRAAAKAKNMSRELFSLGENGDVTLALGGRLWDRTTFAPVDEAAYAALLKKRVPSPRSSHGQVTAVLSARDLLDMPRTLEQNRPLFDQLRGDAVKRVYGYKMLAWPALVDLLVKELGITTVVLVPQEMPEGMIVQGLMASAPPTK